jgi:signal transduction histidine kinase
VVLADRVQLQQLIINLVINGIEAMQPVTDRSRKLMIRIALHAKEHRAKAPLGFIAFLHAPRHSRSRAWRQLFSASLSSARLILAH